MRGIILDAGKWLLAAVAMGMNVGPAAAQTTNASIPGIYEVPGYDPIRSYGDQFDTVDAATGALKLLHTDLVLPLNGEVDVKIQRNYQIHQRVDNLSLWYYNDQGDGRGIVGANWDLHLGRIWTAAGGQIPAANDNTCRNVLNDNSGANRHVLELADGTKLTLYKSSGSTNAFVTGQRWVARCLPASENASGQGGLVVYSPEGIKYTFNRFGYSKSMVRQAYVVTKIEDRNGNSVTVDYISSSTAATASLLLSSIDPQEGGAPTINFYYKDSAGKTTAPFNLDVVLDQIRVGDRTISYDYTEAMQPHGPSYGSASVPRQYFLTRVTQPDSTRWEYTYYPTSNSILTSPIHTVKSPLSGVHSYNYVRATINSLPVGKRERVVVQKRTLVGIGDWLYTYVFSGTYDSDDQTTIAGPTDCVIVRHRILATTLWETGTLRRKSIYEPNCSTLVQDELYTWQGEDISPDNQYSPRPEILSTSTKLPRLQQQQIIREGTSYWKTFSNYDAYGNAGHVEMWQDGHPKRIIDYTYDVKTSPWVLHLVDQERIDGIGALVDVDRSYDTKGNLQSETRFGRVSQFTYHSNGEVHTATDPESHVTTFSDYRAGRARAEIHPEGVNISRAIDQFGNVDDETYAALSAAYLPPGHADQAVVVDYAYDKMSRMTSLVTPRVDDSNVAISYNFASSGATRTITRAAQKIVETYDNFGRKSQVTREDTGSGVAIVDRTEYDAADRPSRTFYPGYGSAGAQAANHIYDALGRLKSTTHSADGSSITFSYQADNKVVRKDESNHNTTFTYRSFGDPGDRELMSIVAPEGQTTTITRDILGKLSQVSQGGVAHGYTYDGRQLLTEETRPEFGTIVYGRDNRGNMTSRKVGTSATTIFTYNGLARLTTVGYPGATPDSAFYYDKFGRPLRVSKGDSQWDYGYDLNGNVVSEVLRLNGALSRTFSIGRSYDGLDHPVGLTLPSGKALAYTHDALGRVTGISQPSGLGTLVDSIQYHASGTMSQFRYGNGRTTTVSETARRWPARFAVVGGGVADFEYGYFSAGDVQSISDYARPQNTRSFTYDGLHRLTGVAGSGGWGNASFTYSATGNMSTKTVGSSSYTLGYDASNKLSSVSGAANWSYGYDTYGNVTNRGAQSFIYDDASNLVRDSLSSTDNYRYDGHNRRYWQRDSLGNQTLSVYALDGALVYQEGVEDGSIKDYVHLGSKLVSRIDYCNQSLDSDGDGIPDCVEREAGLNPLVNDANGDKDGDGLTNLQEYHLGTRINHEDSDGDGMPDGFEVAHGLNPLANDAYLDADGDGLLNIDEFIAGTKPNNADTDNDGVPDGVDPLPLFNVATMIPIWNLLLQ